MSELTKKLKWFRTGESIPYDSKYIRSEIRVVGKRTIQEEDWPPYGGGGYHTEEVPIEEEMHLYEIYEVKI